MIPVALKPRLLSMHQQDYSFLKIVVCRSLIFTATLH